MCTCPLFIKIQRYDPRLHRSDLSLVVSETVAAVRREHRRGGRLATVPRTASLPGHVLCQSWRRRFVAVFGVTVPERFRPSGATEGLRNPVRMSPGKEASLVLVGGKRLTLTVGTRPALPC